MPRLQRPATLAAVCIVLLLALAPHAAAGGVAWTDDASDQSLPNDALDLRSLTILDGPGSVFDEHRYEVDAVLQVGALAATDVVQYTLEWDAASAFAPDTVASHRTVTIDLMGGLATWDERSSAANGTVASGTATVDLAAATLRLEGVSTGGGVVPVLRQFTATSRLAQGLPAADAATGTASLAKDGPIRIADVPRPTGLPRSATQATTGKGPVLESVWVEDAPDGLLVTVEADHLEPTDLSACGTWSLWFAQSTSASDDVSVYALQSLIFRDGVVTMAFVGGHRDVRVGTHTDSLQYAGNLTFQFGSPGRVALALHGPAWDAAAPTYGHASLECSVPSQNGSTKLYSTDLAQDNRGRSVMPFGDVGYWPLAIFGALAVAFVALGIRAAFRRDE